MKLPGSLSTRRFLGQHWQKKPLVIPGGIDSELPALSADELAWLATLDDVESRLVFTDRSGSKTTYRVQSGPFAEQELENLPNTDWTLLVQDVEKHLPDFRAYFQLADFIPDWRIDDLMVSFAAPGGSVGPHLDNYDVFLCQGFGCREWHLSQYDQVRPATQASGLNLIEEFVDDAPILAAAGDVLYLPPGVPHWGIAQEACMTYSLGMRAPTHSEILEYVPTATTVGESPDPDAVYQDPDLAGDEARPGHITTAAIQRVRDLLRAGGDFPDETIAIALGRTVTSLKAWLRPESGSAEDAQSLQSSLDATGTIPVHGMTRLAYWESVDGGVLFCNGISRAVAGNQLAIIRSLCEDRIISTIGVEDAVAVAEGPELLRWLIETGTFDLWRSDQ